MIKKLALVLVLLMFSSPVFAQATFPNDSRRLVTDEWCNAMAYRLQEEGAHRFRLNVSKEDFFGKKLTREKLKEKYKENDIVLARLSHASTAYKNLCEGSVYELIKGALKKLMPN